MPMFFHAHCETSRSFTSGETCASLMPMDPEQKQLLTLSLLPARLNVEQAAQFLGFQKHDMRVLVAARLLRPLGRPSPNSTKYFATVELEALRRDIKWLAKATDAAQSRWRRKNRTDPPTTVQGPRFRSAARPVPLVPDHLANAMLRDRNGAANAVRSELDRS